MTIEIDVSGSDIFCKDYCICAVDNEGIVKGYKFKEEDVEKLKEGFVNKKYTRLDKRTTPSKFKVKIYLIVLKHLLKELFKEHKKEEISILFCRDFPGHENAISRSITHQILNVHKRKLSTIKCGKLPSLSDAHRYAYMMNKDRHNYLSCYCTFSLKDIEEQLIFKKK
jgi:hypothetical protein